MEQSGEYNVNIGVHGREWLPDQVICQGNRCGVIRRVAPKIVIKLDAGGAIVGTQVSLKEKGWRLA